MINRIIYVMSSFYQVVKTFITNDLLLKFSKPLETNLMLNRGEQKRTETKNQTESSDF